MSRGSHFYVVLGVICCGSPLRLPHSPVHLRLEKSSASWIAYVSLAPSSLVLCQRNSTIGSKGYPGKCPPGVCSHPSIAFLSPPYRSVHRYVSPGSYIPRAPVFRGSEAIFILEKKEHPSQNPISGVWGHQDNCKLPQTGTELPSAKHCQVL